MFDELKEVKQFKEIKRLQSLRKAESYLEPKRATRFFVNIFLTAYYFRNGTSIIDVRQGYI